MRKEFNIYFQDGNHEVMEATSVLEVMVLLVEQGVMNKVDKIERR